MSKISSNTLEKLLTVLMEPFKNEKNEKEEKFRTFVTEMYINAIPEEVLKIYEKHSQWFSNASRLYLYLDTDFSKYKSDCNEYIPIKSDRYKKLPEIPANFNLMNAIKEAGKYEYLKTIFNEYKAAERKYAKMYNQTQCALTACDTPTKLQAEMPVAYKVYLEKFDDTPQPNELNAELAKYFL